MKFKGDFVTNSSTTSFVMMGFLIKKDEINHVVETASINSFPTICLNGTDKEILEDMLQIIADAKSFNILSSTDDGLPNGYEIGIGLEIGTISEEDPDETIVSAIDVINDVAELRQLLPGLKTPQIILGIRLS